MRHALPLALAALLLGGCASHKPEDYNGTWINQDAIDAADGSSLHQALSKKGPVLEWKIDTANQQASYSNGFEAVDGYLSAKEDQWQASFTGGQTEQLDLSGDKLRVTSQNGNKQTFVKVPTASANTPLGGSFEKALYTAYLGGEWKIVEGPGKGATVRYHLHPPVLKAMGMDRKIRLGRTARPAFAALRRMKGLRGHWYDPFGRAEVRRIERAMVPEYVAAVERLVAGLTTATRPEAIRIAGLPDQVRGYEDLKLRRAAAYRDELAAALGAYG